MKHAVFLVPGFFGFDRLGGVEYFRHVEEVLKRSFDEAGHEARFVAVPTLPTGSITRRATLLVKSISNARPKRGEKLHIIGHSTGGLDARLLASPGVSLGDGADSLGSRIDSVVTIATPHSGTPIASFFTSLAGKHVLLGVSLFMILSMRSIGGTSYAWLGKLLSFITRFDDILGLDNTILDYLADHLLAELDEERRREIVDFMHQIACDRGALLQLTAEGMDIFNAAVVDNPDVRCFSYATAVPRPGLRTAVSGLPNPYFPASHGLFYVLYYLAGKASRGYPYPPFPHSLEAKAMRTFGFVPGPKDNDGVVPTCSQLWGTPAGLVRGDHLDVCGHFHSPEGRHRHTDWLRSGAALSRETFVALYNDIAARLMEIPRPVCPCTAITTIDN